MDVAIVTGSGGLIGAEACRFYLQRMDRVVGIDNDMRAQFFGAEASTTWATQQLQEQFDNYEHHAVDIRDRDALERIFGTYGADVRLIVHTAAQPSHDWAAREPDTDFSVNAVGTLHLLEVTRAHCPEAVFVFTSTNKVYGDTPNRLPLIEQDTRWEVEDVHPYAARGIDESMTVDQSTHSLFGASKLAADVLVQEYARYFGLATGVFRGGCLTGPGHSGTQLHGFLAYLMKATMTGTPYTVFGYKGKQVRDNIHSADLISAFDAFYRRPVPGAVYNIGGGRHSNCSMLEGIELCEAIAGRRLDWRYEEANRVGDHIWWISDLSRFERDFPEWELRYDVPAILTEIRDEGAKRWQH